MNKALLAVVNEGTLLLGDSTRCCPGKGFSDDEMEMIAATITEKITSDKRFILAVGQNRAKKTQFMLQSYAEPLEEYASNEEYSEDQLRFFIRMEMLYNGIKTDFVIDYEKIFNCLPSTSDDGPYVSYQDGKKLFLMHPFRYMRMAATNGETMIWDTESSELPRIWLERIVFEILDDEDLKVYFDVPDFYNHE